MIREACGDSHQRSNTHFVCMACVLLAAALLCGCKVGPDYHAPSQSMPPQWETSAITRSSVSVSHPADLARWWTRFGDPELDSLIQRAVASNLDLQAAVERIHAARASVGVVSGGLLPTVDGTGGYNRTGGEKLAWGSQWIAGLNEGWNLDVFGGTKRGIEQANASLDASIEDRRDVLVTLLSDLATDYIQLRGQQQELRIARQNLQVQTRNAKITRDKQTLGTGTQLDIVQADAEVSSTIAAIATFESSEQQSIYTISVLLALPPTALEAELSPVERVPDPPAEVPLGMPSDLLRRRPDIRRAERQLAAANAGIGAAIAQLFPQFSLNGSIAIQARRIDLLNWSSSFWSFGPGVSWSILDANIIRSNIDLQNALTEQALTAYRQAVLTALLQVQSVLVEYEHEHDRRIALAEAVRLNEQAVALATRRYEQGLTDFLAVLDSERALFASQDALVLSNQAVSTDAVALYKALGGGWEIEPVPATTQRVGH